MDCKCTNVPAKIVSNVEYETKYTVAGKVGIHSIPVATAIKYES